MKQQQLVGVVGESEASTSTLTQWQAHDPPQQPPPARIVPTPPLVSEPLLRVREANTDISRLIFELLHDGH